jgi:hypothetical protein
MTRMKNSRSESLSKMMRKVQNEMFTFEIDSENALVGWNAEEGPSPRPTQSESMTRTLCRDHNDGSHFWDIAGPSGCSVLELLTSAF